MKNKDSLYESLLNKILSFISYSPRTEREVSKRIDRALVKKKMDGAEKQELKEAVLEEVGNLKLLDDTSYAVGYVEGILRSGKKVSKRKLSDFLYKKGIDRATAEKALSRYPTENESESIRSIIEKKRKTIRDSDPRVVKRKLATYLLGKGFASDQVFEELEGLS